MDLTGNGHFSVWVCLCVCVSLPSTWEKRVTPDRRLLCAATCIDKNQQWGQLTMHFTHAGEAVGVTAQRRRSFRMVIWNRDADSTYLPGSPLWCQD